MDITPQTPVGEIVARYPATSRVFYRHEIDYCCGGRRSLAEACTRRASSLEILIAEITAALDDSAQEECDWQGLGPVALSRYIVERFHVPLREELERLAVLADKALAAHGATYAEWLPELVRILAEMSEDLLAHMEKEEKVLFPMIERLADTASGGRGVAAFVGEPIRMMVREHEDAGNALARLREVSSGYRPPEGACATVQALLQGLHQFEQEMHRHVHLENSVLFPQALTLASGGRS